MTLHHKSLSPSSPEALAAYRQPIGPVARVVGVYCAATGITLGHLRSLDLTRSISGHRHVATWLARQATDRCISRIAHYLGRDRTTASYSIAVVERRRREDAAYREWTDELLARARAALAEAGL